MTDSIQSALTGFLPSVRPEVVLGLAACVLFLGGTFKACRGLWGGVALLALAGAGLALYLSATSVPTVEARRADVEGLREKAKAAGPQSEAEAEYAKANEDLQALLYSARPADAAGAAAQGDRAGRRGAVRAL